MATGAIVAIVVAAVIIIAVVALMLPRLRAGARERELQHRRDRMAGEHRAEAEERERQASRAEERARIAEREAEAERAQARLHEERAGLHERGMADDELTDDRSDRDGDGVLDDSRADHERPARFNWPAEEPVAERSEQRY